MKKLASILLGSALAVAMVACNNAAKTGSSAPDTDGGNANPASTNTDKNTAQTNQDDATSKVRREQLNSDIRSREQRNNAGGDRSNKLDSDIKSQVRSKLEANLPAASLAIDAKDGAVTVSGTVVNAEQLQKIESLTKEIGGVKSVVVKATVSGVKPDVAPKPGSEIPTKSNTGQ